MCTFFLGWSAFVSFSLFRGGATLNRVSASLSVEFLRRWALLALLCSLGRSFSVFLFIVGRKIYCFSHLCKLGYHLEVFFHFRWERAKCGSFSIERKSSGIDSFLNQPSFFFFSFLFLSLFPFFFLFLSFFILNFAP